MTFKLVIYKINLTITLTFAFSCKCTIKIAHKPVINLTIYSRHHNYLAFIVLVLMNSSHQLWLIDWFPLLCFFGLLEAADEIWCDLSHWQISSTNWRCGIKCHRERSPYCSLWGKCHCQSESAVRTKRNQQSLLSCVSCNLKSACWSHIYSFQFSLFNIIWNHCAGYLTF